jgi:hypothetical protein
LWPGQNPKSSISREATQSEARSRGLLFIACSDNPCRPRCDKKRHLVNHKRHISLQIVMASYPLLLCFTADRGNI